MSEKDVLNNIVDALTDDETLSTVIKRVACAESHEIPFFFSWPMPCIAVIPGGSSHTPAEMPNTYKSELLISVYVYVDIQIPTDEQAGFMGDSEGSYKGCVELSEEIERILDGNTFSDLNILFAHKAKRSPIRRALSDKGKYILFRELGLKYVIG